MWNKPKNIFLLVFPAIALFLLGATNPQTDNLKAGETPQPVALSPLPAGQTTDMSPVLPTHALSSKPIEARVMIIDASLTADILLKEVATKVNNGGLIELCLTGENVSSSYRRLEYRIDWFDAAGMKLQTVLSHWAKFPVYKNSVFSLRAVSPNQKATDFKIFIRKGD